MNYQKMRILSYNDHDNIEAEYEKRFNSYSTERTNLLIHPFNLEARTSDVYPLFYLYLSELEIKKNVIFNNSEQLKKILKSLPKTAVNSFVVSNLVTEINNTNEYEGVRSTAKEIKEAYDNIKTDKKIKFKSIVNSYNNIMNDENQKISTAMDIRTIYDNLFDDEPGEAYKPKGKYFRNSDIGIFDERVGKWIHKGNPDELSILDDIGKLIVFMNRQDIPFLEKAIISHYFLEYIHPFEDGNGRLGRFLLSSYLSRKLDKITALSISSSVIENRKTYEAAFVEVSNPRNMGEITFFISDMIDIITKGQNNSIEKLKELQDSLKKSSKFIDTLELTKVESRILFVFIQSYLFDIFSSHGLKNKRLENILKIGRTPRMRAINSLKDKELLRAIDGDSYSSIITDYVIEEISK